MKFHEPNRGSFILWPLFEMYPMISPQRGAGFCGPWFVRHQPFVALVQGGFVKGFLHELPGLDFPWFRFRV